MSIRTPFSENENSSRSRTPFSENSRSPSDVDVVEDAVAKINFPIGWRFVPSDEELITCYLTKKMALTPLPTQIIKEIDAIHFYDQHPKNLVQNVWYHRGDPYLEPDEWYFFIHHDEYFDGKVSPQKQVGHNVGYWRFKGKEEPLYNAHGNVFAYKIHSTFFSANSRKIHWKMEKYRCINTTSDKHSPRAREEWVVARIRRGKRYSFS